MKIKKQVVITGIGLDYPSGMAASRQALEMAKGFEALGIDPILIPFASSSTSDNPNSGEIDGIEYRYLVGRNMNFSGVVPGFLCRLFQPVLTAFALLCFLKNQRRKTDLLLVDTSNRTLPLLIEAVICRLLGVSMVYCLWEEVFTQRVFRQRSWVKKALMATESALEVPVLYGLVLKIPKEIWCVSKNLTILMKSWGNDERRVRFFPVSKSLTSGFFENGMVQKKHVENDDQKHIVFTGSINDQRDEFYSLLDAIVLMREQGHNVVLDLYGRDDQGAVKRIENYATSLQHKDAVVFHGFVSDQVLSEVISNAFVAIALKKNISFNHYNFPSRVLGYLSEKCPVVIPLNAHWSHLFQHLESAVIVDMDNSLDIAEQLLKVIEDEERCERIKKGGFEVLSNSFNMEENLKRVLEGSDQWLHLESNIQI